MDKRDQLDRLIDELISVYHDDNITVDFVGHSTHAATCAECSDYGDQIFESITLMYSR